MSKDVFCDSDFLSAFLSVEQLSIPLLLYKNSIVIPQIVVDELLKSGNEGYRETLQKVRNMNMVRVEDICVDQDAADLYIKFTDNPDAGMKAVGRGEAAVMAMAINKGGVVASNNLKDVLPYIKTYGLDHITTGIVIHKAVLENKITKADADDIWRKMILRNCKLGAETYDEYVKGEMYHIDYE